MEAQGIFGRIGRGVVRHAWWVIAVWVVLGAVVLLLSPAMPKSVSESDSLPQGSESVQAAKLGTDAFPAAFSPSVIMVFQRADGKPLSGADSARIAGIAPQVQGKNIPGVQAVLPGPPSPNKLVQTIGVKLPKLSPSNQAEVRDSVKALRAELPELTAGTGLKVGTTGVAAQNVDTQEASSHGEALIGIATVLLILVLLLIIFRSPIIALFPIVVIGIVSQIANGLIACVATWFGLKTDSSVTSLLIVVLFGIGTDYILFLMFRYRERLRAGEEPKQAMVSAVSRVGEAIASAGGVVIIAFLAMTLSSFGLFRAMGPSLAIAVAVTVLAGLTLVPAVVSLIGTKVFWPSKSWRRQAEAARFGALGKAVGRRPAVFAVASGVVMVALGLGALHYQPNFDLASNSLPTNAESQVAMKDLQKGLPAGMASPTNVYLRADAPLDPGALAGYRTALSQVDGVGQVAGPEVSKDGRTASYTLTLRPDPASTEAIDLVSGPLRDKAHTAAPPGSTALVGGTTAVFADIGSVMSDDYKLVFPVAAVLIAILLGLLLRSVVAPWYVMVSVGLGFAATLGATTFLFQDFAGKSGLIFMMPLIIYMFVVALGTDYNILMVARLREETAEGHGPGEATALAIRHTGPTIGAAGVILAGSFAALTLAGSPLLAEMGFALAAGILIAAFVMALFFTPSLTALIGKPAWWPGKVAPRAEHADETAPERVLHRT
ncbi:MMPL family transporter [Amycolatopsis anabasis]|uniref:MMPL family transporter n=1 Tax=Amycolatopsis anabasis TaxID=1840409 RepID=UPI00131D1B2C|nr:efflux RND transporter permease subunit [Amycolatopsis anabasis]